MCPYHCRTFGRPSCPYVPSKLPLFSEPPTLTHAPLFRAHVFFQILNQKLVFNLFLLKICVFSRVFTLLLNSRCCFSRERGLDVACMVVGVYLKLFLCRDPLRSKIRGSELPRGAKHTQIVKPKKSGGSSQLHLTSLFSKSWASYFYFTCHASLGLASIFTNSHAFVSPLFSFLLFFLSSLTFFLFGAEH